MMILIMPKIFQKIKNNAFDNEKNAKIKEIKKRPDRDLIK
jgi:hypothetical protein